MHHRCLLDERTVRARVIHPLNGVKATARSLGIGSAAVEMARRGPR